MVTEAARTSFDMYDIDYECVRYDVIVIVCNSNKNSNEGQ